MKTSLSVLGFFVLAFHLFSASAQADEVHHRYNAYSPEGKHMLELYAKGVAKMQQLSKDKPLDPTGWIFQANMHGVYPNEVPPNVDPDMMHWNGCQHGSFVFLSWHRMYLYYFESIVRAACGDESFALPYWDYGSQDITQSAIPPEFRDPHSPLFVADRNDGINDGLRLDPADVSAVDALAAPSFMPSNASPFGFGGGTITTPNHGASKMGVLEGSPHGSVHVAVGGWMGAFETAGRDPIFWLHHANIDRLWEVWRQTSASHKNPVTNTFWTSHAFPFYDQAGNPVTHTGGKIETGLDLNYVYDNSPVSTPLAINNDQGGATGAPAAPIAPVEPKETVIVSTSATAEKIILDGGSPSTQISLKAEDSQNITETAHPAVPAAPGAKRPHLGLRIEGIEFDAIPKANYQVYVNLPEGTVPDEKGPYYAGPINFFSVAQHHVTGKDPHADHEADGNKGKKWTIPLNKAVEKLLESQKWDASKLKITFVPSSLRDNEGKRVVPKKVIPCKIAGVSIVKIQ